MLLHHLRQLARCLIAAAAVALTGCVAGGDQQGSADVFTMQALNVPATVGSGESIQVSALAENRSSHPLRLRWLALAGEFPAGPHGSLYSQSGEAVTYVAPSAQYDTLDMVNAFMEFTVYPEDFHSITYAGVDQSRIIRVTALPGSDEWTGAVPGDVFLWPRKSVAVQNEDVEVALLAWLEGDDSLPAGSVIRCGPGFMPLPGEPFTFDSADVLGARPGAELLARGGNWVIQRGPPGLHNRPSSEFQVLLDGAPAAVDNIRGELAVFEVNAIGDSGFGRTIRTPVQLELQGAGRTAGKDYGSGRDSMIIVSSYTVPR